jgi:hypothetical protein
MLLIEEKIGSGFSSLYSDKRCARCVMLRPLREMFHATALRNRNVRNASLKSHLPCIENNMVPLPFSRDQVLKL